MGRPVSELLASNQRKAPPFEFVLDALARLPLITRPMFGCLAVYIEDKIVLVVRDRPDSRADNGVWLATTREHHVSLKREFPRMRSIRMLSKNLTNWQILPVDAPDFEEAALRACHLILDGDPRIGKIPEPRRTTSPARRSSSRSRK